jgi:hypothetical protein
MRITKSGPDGQPGEQRGGPTSVGPFGLFLLLALGMSLLAVLPSILGVLLGVGRVFFSLCVVAIAVMFGRSAMGLGGILVMFSRLIVLVSSHWIPPVIVQVTQ